MNLNEAKKILKEHGYLLEYFTEEGVLEKLESDKLKALAAEIQQLKYDGKPAFPIQGFGEVFNGDRHGFMIRIQLPNSRDSGTFLNIRESYIYWFNGKHEVEEGFSASGYGYFWNIVNTLEQLGLYENWTTLFRSKRVYPLEDLIPFLKDLLKVWDEDFYRIVKKFADKDAADEIAADIASYKGRNWSGD